MSPQTRTTPAVEAGDAQQVVGTIAGTDSTATVVRAERVEHLVFTTLNVDADDLDGLARVANDQHGLALMFACEALDAAVVAGTALLAAKKVLRRGAWGEWLNSNFTASSRTAQGYMLLAANAQRVADMGAVSMREALKALSSKSGAISPQPDIGTRVHTWASKLNNVLVDGARLRQEIEDTPDLELDAHASLALLIYDRITEKKLDAEIRAFLDQETGGEA